MIYILTHIIAGIVLSIAIGSCILGYLNPALTASVLIPTLVALGATARSL